MDMTAFASTKPVRPALQSIALFLIVAMSMMTMVKPAHASGSVNRTSALSWCSHLNNPATCVYSTNEAACHALAATMPLYYNEYVHFYSGQEIAGWACLAYSLAHPDDGRWGAILGWLAQAGACPSNSIPASATTCTCNDPYAPDPTATSCVLEQYTISLSGLGGEVATLSSRAAAARVMDGTTPKSGAQVSLTLTEVPEEDGYNHAVGQHTAPHIGSLNPTAGTTGADGKLRFYFIAPAAGGIHTITATCDGCSNQATGTIKVPGCPVKDLPSITDKEVQLFEDNPDRSDTARLTPRMDTALSCLLRDAAAGSPTTGSAYRPPAYNQHLIDVWRKWVEELRRNTNPVCADLKLKIQTHFQRHKLKVTQGPVPRSLHTLGEAVDVTISLPPANIDALAAGCQLRRPLPVTDSVHFIHQ